MTNSPFPIINGRAFRVTRLDRCGLPDYGNFAYLVSEGFISVALTSNYDEGTAIQSKNANGKFCVNKPAEPEMESIGVEVVLCKVDPDAFTAFTGMPKITDPLTGDTIGFKVNRGIRPGDIRVALEVWSDASDAAGCDLGDFPYAYQLLPFLQGGRLGDYTVENNVVNFTITGMVSLDDNSWGDGPYEVVTDAEGDPAPLSAATDVEELDHLVVLRTIVAPPAATDGLVPLDDPADPDATTATAGIPGTFNGVRPFDLAALIASSITGSGGATAWTTGQYVILGDGSHAYWKGSGATPKWGAGEAP